MADVSPRKLRSVASLNAFTFSGTQSFLVTLYPFLAERFHLSLSSVIAAFAFGSFLFVAGSPFWAAKSDTWGRQKVLALGSTGLFVSFALVAVLSLLEGLSTVLVLSGLIFSRLVYGLVASSIAPVAQSLQADATDNPDTTRGMFLHSLSLSLGRVFTLAAFVILGAQIQHMLLAVGVWIAGVVVINWLTPHASLPLATESREHATSSNDLQQASNWKWVLAVAFLFTCFIEALNSSLAGQLKTILDLDSHEAAQFGARVFLVCGLGILTLQAGRGLIQKLSWGSAMAIGVGSLILGSLLFAAAETPTLLWVALSFLTIGTGLVPPLYLSLVGRGAPAGQYGRRAGMVGSSQTLGYASGAGVVALSLHLGLERIGYLLFLIAISLAFACFRFPLAQLSIFNPNMKRSRP